MALAGRKTIIYTPDEIMAMGFELAGFDRHRQKVKRKTNLDRFRGAYGSAPVVVACIWEGLLTTSNPEARIDCKAAKHIDRFLLALHFLKVYPTERREAGIFGVDKTTTWSWHWYFIEKIQALKKEKIVWPEEWTNGGDDIPTFLYSVDGTHCCINEPKHLTESKNPKFYSPKHHKAAVNYEVALSLWEPRVIHLEGPMKAMVHNVTTFRKELKEKTPAGKRGIGNKGYRGERGVISTPSSHDTAKVRRFKSCARARQETFNAQIKFFGCLAQRFRHGIEKHQQCSEAICMIVQYQMENGSPVFDI